MKKVIALLAVLAIFFSACKKDVKLTTTWKECMVIYGLLNQSDSIQYIRINRTFLGQGNAYQMASVHDSTNYPYKLNVKLERWSSDGLTLLGTYKIDTTTGIPQDPGAFANSPQVLYRVYTPLSGVGSNPLIDDGSSEYHLTVVNPVTGYTATAKTTLVQGVNSTSGSGLAINSPGNFSTSYNFASLTAPFKITWTTGIGGRLYQAILRFHYTETTGTGTTNQYVDMDFGQLTSVSTLGGETMNQYMSWDQFESFINASIPDNPLVASRVFGNCDLIMYAATDEFNTYMLVNQPVSSITGDKPTYTNIQNGIGLFSARYKFSSSVYSKPLTYTTIDNESVDSRTCHLHFEDHTGAVPACP